MCRYLIFSIVIGLSLFDQISCMVNNSTTNSTLVIASVHVKPKVGFVGSGFLVSPKALLTTSRIVFGIDKTKLFVVFTNAITTPYTNIYNVEQVNIHPEYKGTEKDDIAVLILEKEVIDGKVFQLPDDIKPDSLLNKIVTTFVWKFNGEVGSADYAYEEKSMTVPHNKWCSHFLRDFIPSDQICAKGGTLQYSLGLYDVGVPLIENFDNSSVSTLSEDGLLAFGIFSRHGPMIISPVERFMFLPRYVSWIKEVSS